MTLPTPHFLVNFKTYDGTGGRDGRQYAQTIEAVAAETGATFAIAPQTPDIRLVADHVDLPIVAQHVDAAPPGRGMGQVLPETVAEAGADAALVNHPERPASLDAVVSLVDRCRDAGLDTVVCVTSVEAGRTVASVDPDWLLFENPADIATGDPMADTHPERIEAFVDAVAAVNPRTNVLVGGGVETAADVRATLSLGADATGAASVVANATDRRTLLEAFAAALTA